MNASELRAAMAQAMKDGMTVEELGILATEANATIAAEQEKEDKLAEARLKAAEAMAEYITELTGEKQEVEEMYAHLEETEDMAIEAFGFMDALQEAAETGSEPKVRVTVIDGEDAPDAFEALMKKLGL